MGAKRRTLRVLVVDDNRDAANSLAKLAALWGHEVQAAYDAAALHAVAVFEPDVILLDIVMPKVDGIRFARLVRQKRDRQQTSIIVVTGYHREGLLRLAVEAGIDHYLLKPVDPGVLQRLLWKRLEEVRHP